MICMREANLCEKSVSSEQAEHVALVKDDLFFYYLCTGRRSVAALLAQEEINVVSLSSFKIPLCSIKVRGLFVKLEVEIHAEV